MAPVAFAKPVEDSVARVNNEVAVGEDLDFQRSWWKFERVVWIVFSLILVADLAGLFGRGPLAHALLVAPGGSFQVKYDRIVRAESPTILDIDFKQSAIHDGNIKLFVSESLVKEIGTQRVIPAPISTSLGNGGLTYTFPATDIPASVQFAMQPSAPGIYHFALQVPGDARVESKVVVLPSASHVYDPACSLRLSLPYAGGSGPDAQARRADDAL